MNRLTNEELTAIRERAEKASGVEWVRLENGTVIALTGDGIAFDLVVREVESNNHVNDEHFIAHAREDIPKMLAEIIRLRSIADDLLYSSNLSYDEIERYEKLISGDSE